MLNLRNMNKLVYGNGFTMYQYTNWEDTLHEIMQEGYFNDLNPSKGDWILINAKDGSKQIVVSEICFNGWEGPHLVFVTALR